MDFKSISLFKLVGLVTTYSLFKYNVMDYKSITLYLTIISLFGFKI